jgi:predicted RecB family nuclease
MTTPPPATSPLTPPLDAYAARSCPTVVQWDVLRPVEPLGPTGFQRLLQDRGIRHEQAVIDVLLATHPGTVDAGAAGDRLDRLEATVAALTDGAPLVVRTRLPYDLERRRVGEADVLVRVGDAPLDGRWRYVPVEVKLRRTLDGDGPGAELATGAGSAVLPVGVQALADLRVPAPEGCVPVGAGAGGSGVGDDLVQLAHYHRLLETCGHAWWRDADGAVIAGIIGAEGVVAWHRLDVERLSVGEEVDADRRESALERYDREFAHRLAVADAARAHAVDPSGPLLEEPVRVSECTDCRWRAHCDGLREASRDVSVLPRATRNGVWPALRAAGLGALDALAAHDPARPIGGLTAGAVATLVDEARARVAPDFAHRRRGVDAVPVERGDVEVDLDMENTDAGPAGGAYLWGTWVTDRAGTGLAPEGYRPHVAWDADPAAAGAAAFGALWDWLTDLRAACRTAGASLRVYCWHQQAEVGWLRAGARQLAAAGGPDRGLEVEALVASDDWIDLKLVWQRQVVTGYGSGLKLVAGRLGFAWDDDDPGGAQSIVWWTNAVDPGRTEADRAAWRARILAYNRDDVRATLHVRKWLAGATLLPPPVPERGPGTVPAG